MEVFWRKGYVATSLSDLYAATGLKPGNLYATFRDKEELFRQAFETYAAHFRASLPDGLEGRAAVEAWIDVQVRLAVEDPERKGCLIVNTVTEREAHSPAIAALADQRLQEIRGFFRHHLEIAAARGEIAEATDRDGLADQLLGAVVAIMSLARAGVPASAVVHVGEGAKAALGPRPRPA